MGEGGGVSWKVAPPQRNPELSHGFFPGHIRVIRANLDSRSGKLLGFWLLKGQAEKKFKKKLHHYNNYLFYYTTVINIYIF